MLHERANDVIVIVANWSHTNEVDQNYANDVFASDSRVSLSKFLISNPRNNELVLARLTTIYVVIGVEKGPIIDHKGHLKALMHDLKIAIPVHRRNLHFLVIRGQDLTLILEVLNELLWHHVLHLDLADVEGRAVAIPHLMLNQVVLLVCEYNRNFALARQELSRFI